MQAHNESNELKRQRCIAVAETIRHQIGMQTLMACGAREYRCGWSSEDYPHLTMRVGDGKRGLWVRVTLMPSDTYTVELFKMMRVQHVLKQIEEFEDVYCDMLSNIIYRMVNK